jgi:VacB/RNase II family 3'-5' exoribonuclease
MKSVADPESALTQGLAAVRDHFQVPKNFPAEVLAAAEAAALRVPSAHVDRTDRPFVTLDPATSGDLDQAFAIERSGADLILHYAIADVAWFVNDDDPIDKEAWRRGTTFYLPDGKAGLYPPVLSEKAASLLPDGPRPAVIFTVRVTNDGSVKLDGTERAMIQSRAKLGYEQVKEVDLPPDFADFAARIQAAEQRRGAARVDPPEQEVAATDDGHFALSFRPRLESETRNAALSLAANMAIADVLQAHHTGLFRVMAPPDDGAILRLRHTAQAFGLVWPAETSLTTFSQSLSADNAKQAAFMLAVRRAGKGASYVPYRDGITPWHAAMGATYSHATAPLRRLADRYVVRATLAISNGQPVPDAVTSAFQKLPEIMAQAGARGGQIERAVVDLAEAVMLEDKVGQIFSAIVTDVDERGLRIQLRDFPIVSRLGEWSEGGAAKPGDLIEVKLASAVPATRTITFAI